MEFILSTFASPFARLRLYGCLVLAGLVAPLACAQSLQSILADALVNDPQLLEAKANEIGAHNAMKATRAGHYPVLSMVGNQMLVREDDPGTPDARKFNPGLKGTLNVYSWGGISSAVKRDKEKERYYHHKYDETREELGNTIGQLYLEAVRAQETLRILEQNLQRHDKIIHDLEIIVKHDVGRRSELTQAKSRRLQVESTMAQTRRSMDLALSRLSRYTSEPLKAQGLQGPFTDLKPDEIIQRYRNPDLTSTPSYQAQEAELESARANVKVSKAARLPALNLEGQVTRDTKELYLNFSWNIFDQAAKYSVAQNAQTMIAAESRLNQMLREVTEKSRTAETDMQQSSKRAAITKAQIAAQQQVVKAYELQFKIARRNLIDVLDSYGELAGVEMAHVTAQNDYRDAALSYLRAQAQIFNWASNLTTAAPATQAKLASHGTPVQQHASEQAPKQAAASVSEALPVTSGTTDITTGGVTGNHKQALSSSDARTHSKHSKTETVAPAGAGQALQAAAPTALTAATSPEQKPQVLQAITADAQTKLTEVEQARTTVATATAPKNKTPKTVAHMKEVKPVAEAVTPVTTLQEQPLMPVKRSATVAVIPPVQKIQTAQTISEDVAVKQTEGEKRPEAASALKTKAPESVVSVKEAPQSTVVVATPVAAMQEQPLQPLKPLNRSVSTAATDALPGEMPLKPVAVATDLLSAPQPLPLKAVTSGEQKLAPVNTRQEDDLDLYIHEQIAPRPVKQESSRKPAATGDSLEQYINTF